MSDAGIFLHVITDQVRFRRTGEVEPLELERVPPLVFSEEDVRWFLSAFEQVMVKLHQFPGPVWELMKKLGKHAMTKRSREPVEV